MSRQVALLEGDVPRHYAAVALDVPLDRTFTYAVPAELADVVVRGARVAVPWRNRARTGIVLDAHTTLDEELPPEKVRPLIDVLDATPMVPEVQLALCEWIARYYHAPIGECVRMATPSEASIRSSRLVTCTDLDAPDSLDETAVALLDVFAAAGRPLPPDEIVGAVRGARHVDLNALEAQGLVASEYVVGESRVRTKTVDIVRFVARDDRHLGAVQKRVVDYVETAGEATDAELRDAVDATRATLRTLARRGIVDIRTEEVLRDPFEGPVRRREADPTLTDEQATAIAEIDEAMAASTGSTVLVHGVTGSGKTELYLRVIRAALAEGRRGLVLLPEIALTPQFVGVFREALGDIIAVLHSGLSPGQRYDQWRRIRRGDVQVVIGARSALFAPLDDIGVVVVDEEHDSSFKQEEGVRYQARDAAIVLAHRLGAVCLLGSATPSLESLSNARRGRFGLVRLSRRVYERPLPEMDVVDLRDHPSSPEDPVSQWLSPPLQLAVREAARAGEQAILFLNRRGFAPTVQCMVCAHVFECPECDISLTYHRRRRSLVCHYCGHAVAMPETCPTCRSEAFDREGAGTEKIEHLIETAFDGLRVGRLDRDTSRGRGLQRVLGAFRSGELDVLVGTQMVTKGHDFPNVTLVGVLDADHSLRFPDFRSNERTFQLLTQVAGRAGRGSLPGRVVIQTHRPDHFVISSAVDRDFERFVRAELAFRERLDYPPFGHVLALRFDGPEYGALHRIAEAITGYVADRTGPGLRVLGPVDSPMARIRGRYRMQALVRGRDRSGVHRAADLALHRRASLGRELSRADVRAHVDIDPGRLL